MLLLGDLVDSNSFRFSFDSFPLDFNSNETRINNWTDIYIDLYIQTRWHTCAVPWYSHANNNRPMRCAATNIRILIIKDHWPDLTINAPHCSPINLYLIYILSWTFTSCSSLPWILNLLQFFSSNKKTNVIDFVSDFGNWLQKSLGIGWCT